MNQETSKNNQTFNQTKGPIRRPAVAGAFYPEEPGELEKMISNFLSKVQLDTAKQMATNSRQIATNYESDDMFAVPRILIVPHAGLVYSGQVAAYSYKAVESLDYQTVILIGPSHTAYFEGVSIYPKGFYETPLGQVPIDDELASQLIKADEEITSYPEAHLNEHNLEVQLPFIQTVLPRAKIVPILMSQPSEGVVQALTKAIKKVINEKILIVISSDLSHYPEYEVAVEVDKKTISAILTKETLELDETINESMAQAHPGLDTCACGEAALKVGMNLARELELEGKLLKYANSGDVSGDESRVVGYASIVFYRGDQGLLRVIKGEQGDEELDQDDKKKLLNIARETLESYLKEGKIPALGNFEVSASLQKNVGAFVTLRNKKRGHELRGCIGRFSPTDIPLYQVVQEMAVAAATEDVRFESVTFEELKDIEIEISVLSNLIKIDDWRKIEVGKHGVEVVQGWKKGVFLPQVAVENNWDLETFMNELCENKAGISRDAWKTGEAEVYVFTAEVFGE